MSRRSKILDNALMSFKAPEDSPACKAELPQISAARERNRIARARVAAGEDYRPSKDELLEARAWKRGKRQ